MEDPLVPPVDDTLVTPEARRRAEGASANATRELGVKDTHTHTHTQQSQSNVLNYNQPEPEAIAEADVPPCRAPSSRDPDILRCR